MIVEAAFSRRPEQENSSALTQSPEVKSFG